MRRINLASYKIITSGVNYEVTLPISGAVLAMLMERKESHVYWLQPYHGTVDDQIAAVCLNNVMYSMNLRVEKAVFRRIRLNRSFVNLERLQDGTPKLRIPTRLHREKMRTSQRHTVNTQHCFCMK